MVPINLRLVNFVEKGGSLSFLAELSEVLVSHLWHIMNHNRGVSVKAQSRIISAIYELEQAKVGETAKIKQCRITKAKFNQMYLQRKLKKAVKIP